MFDLSSTKVKKKPRIPLGYVKITVKTYNCSHDNKRIPSFLIINSMNNQNNKMDIQARNIAEHWLEELAFTAATGNLHAHMALVSRQVKVLGLPGNKLVDYQGWKRRRHNEFSKRLLQK